MSVTLPPRENESARHLWRQAGFTSEAAATPLSGGANNRVYRLTDGARAALLKIYYYGAGDPRDRFGTETAFTRFLGRHGVAAAPRLLACDPSSRMALYEFIEGRTLTATDVTAEHVQSALEFVSEINRHREAPDADALPAASEACFSITEHLACIDRRVERLRTINVAAPIDQEARDFVERDLAAAWSRVRDRALRASHGVENVRAELPLEERCLSPSDFGFHNALVDSQGRLRFFDFEYAGWDDPAKLVCDFFCQVDVPVPQDEFPGFAQGVAEAVARDPEAAIRRSELLLPVYRVKWCCILLNEFLPSGAGRRSFSRGSDDRKAEQLAKAKTAHERIRPD